MAKKREKIVIKDLDRAYRLLEHERTIVRMKDEWSDLFQQVVPVDRWTMGVVVGEGEKRVVFTDDGTLFSPNDWTSELLDSTESELVRLKIPYERKTA